MDFKLMNGEYLAPRVEVMEMSVQGMLCQSPEIDPGNPFDPNDEEIW